MLALRDELASRRFDDPSTWWAAHPFVVGGRDQVGGGTWCASDLRSGITAVVLNRPEKRRAAPGAPSRGVLPLLAVQHAERWPEFVDVGPMAGFNLVLAGPDTLSWWSYDGDALSSHGLQAGTHMFTPKGLAVPLLDERFAPENTTGISLPAGTATVVAEWLPIIRDTRPADDPLALLVRVPVGDDTFETVFGQFIAARPGALRLDYSRTPDRPLPWTTVEWEHGAGAATLTG
jgi:uncharacterized protein with NRDE domain